MSASRHRPLAALTWMAIASVFFAFMTLTARHTSRRVPWAEVAFARGAMAWVVAVGIARARGLSLRITNRKLSWGRSILGTASMMISFYLYAHRDIPLGDITAIGALSPVMIALAAPWLLGESTGRRVAWATPIGFAGVVVLVQPNFQVAGHLAFLCLVSTAMSAGAMLFLRKLGEGETPEAVAAHFAGVSSLACLAWSLPTFEVPDGEALAWLCLTGLLGGLGQLSMTHAYALDNAARVGAAGYVGTVLTLILATVLLGEATSPAQVAGSAMVIASGLVLGLGALKSRPQRASAASMAGTKD